MTSDRSNGGAELQLNQPVTSKTPSLNPNAKVFTGGTTTTSTLSTTPTLDNGDIAWKEQDNSNSPSPTTTQVVAVQGPYQINGDVGGKYTTGTVFPSPSDSPIPITHLTVNGYPTTEMTFTPSTEGQLVSGEELALDANQPKEDGLRAMLKYQLEYYFSRENLASDTYLRSQMDSDQYVPIWTIANFNAVKRLTNDLNLIVEVLSESPYLQVDDKGERVRPITKRCIVMLREIPDATPLEEVKALFSGANCPKFTSCEFAHNCNWYVTFETEADAQNAYKYLREEVQTFRGKPIMARIKAKPLQSYTAKLNGLRSPTTPTPVPTSTTTTTNIYPQQQFQYSPVSPIINGAQQQPFAFYNPNIIPQQWPTSPPPYFEAAPMAPFPGNGIAPPNKYHHTPMNVTRYNYQPKNRNQTKTHQRASSTPEPRTVERNNNHEIHRSIHDRNSTANGTHNLSPRNSRDNGDRRDIDRENGYRGRRDNTSPKLGQQDNISHQGSLPASRRGGYSRRGRRREDEAPGRRNSRDKREEISKPPSPRLDLASQFPPLPGRENVVKTEETENKLLMTPMADILKGVKDPKRPMRVSLTETAPQHKETTQNDIGTQKSGSPPASPTVSPTTTKVQQGSVEDRPCKDVTLAVTNSKPSSTQHATANNSTAQKQDEGLRSQHKLSYAQMLTQMPVKKPSAPQPPVQKQEPQQQQTTSSQQKPSSKQTAQAQRQSVQRQAAVQPQQSNKSDSAVEQSCQNGENCKDPIK